MKGGSINYSGFRGPTFRSWKTFVLTAMLCNATQGNSDYDHFWSKIHQWAVKLNVSQLCMYHICMNYLCVRNFYTQYVSDCNPTLNSQGYLQYHLEVWGFSSRFKHIVVLNMKPPNLKCFKGQGLLDQKLLTRKGNHKFWSLRN